MLGQVFLSSVIVGTCYKRSDTKKSDYEYGKARAKIHALN
jgi:hypothetical protein